MREFTFIFVLSFIAFPFLQSCNYWSSSEKRVEGNGVIVNRLLEVQDFDSISMDCVGEIIYEQVSEEDPYFQITTDENVLPYIDFRVENGCLMISRNDTIVMPSKLKIYTNSRSLGRIVLCDSAVIQLAGEVNAKRLDMYIEGRARVRTDSLFCEELRVDVADFGNVDLVGASNRACFRTRGNGAVNSESFIFEEFEDCEVLVEG